MIKSFIELKNTRKDNFTKLTEKLNQMAQGVTYENDDDRFWQPTVDKAGNGYAVIRFLPPPNNEEWPFIREWSHGFKGPGGWYIEKSLTTLGKTDPVSEYNTKLWNSGIKEDKEFVQGSTDKQGSKRKLAYISNIYVVKDESKPENNGKVFLYRYGKKIYDKICEAANPKFPDVEAFDAFDLWGGANFKLKIRKADGYRNYDASEWDLVENEEGTTKRPRGPLFNDEDKMEKIWKSEYPLSELVAPEKFKSYGELKLKLAKVLGFDQADADYIPGSKSETIKEKSNGATAPSPVIRTVDEDVEDQTPPWIEPKEGSEDNLDYYKKLAEE